MMHFLDDCTQPGSKALHVNRISEYAGILLIYHKTKQLKNTHIWLSVDGYNLWIVLPWVIG